MLPKKPHTAADVERGVRASPDSIPVVCAQWLAAVYTCRFRTLTAFTLTLCSVWLLLQAITIPASQGVSRIQELGTPRTPGSPSPLLSPSAGPEDGSPDDIVPYDAGKWDFKLTDALQVAGGFAHTFFTFYVTLV